LIVKDTLGSVVRAKTGSGRQDQQYVGWYVGYVTTKDNIYYFSNCIQSSDKNPDFGKARIEILSDILDELKRVTAVKFYIAFKIITHFGFSGPFVCPNGRCGITK